MVQARAVRRAEPKHERHMDQARFDGSADNAIFIGRDIGEVQLLRDESDGYLYEGGREMRKGFM